jgi:hypothetical protein
MSAQEILAELPRLSVEERAELAKALQELAVCEDAQEASPAPAVSARKAGLHEGAWTIADDFDDPLPDEFWLGEDA